MERARTESVALVLVGIGLAVGTGFAALFFLQALPDSGAVWVVVPAAVVAGAAVATALRKTVPAIGIGLFSLVDLLAVAVPPVWLFGPLCYLAGTALLSVDGREQPV